MLFPGIARLGGRAEPERQKSLVKARMGKGVRRGGSGFTLIEIAFATTVLLVALMSMSASIFSLHSLRRQNRERTLARNACVTRVESAHSVARSAVDQPGAWATNVVAASCPGGGLDLDFDIPGLTPWPGETHVGKVTFVVDETLTDAALGVALGMPRDLDGDGLIDNHDVRDTARILPVIVRARWDGVRGRVQIVRPFVAIGY